MLKIFLNICVLECQERTAVLVIVGSFGAHDDYGDGDDKVYGCDCYHHHHLFRENGEL
jgi:hypothetical protein